MSQQNIDFGAFPDDPNADAIRTAFDKVQQNFDELYGAATAGTVTSVNRGAGITVNTPTGNVIVTANIACVQVTTSSLSLGLGANGGTSATITTSAQILVIDINPANVFSNNFAANSTGGLANFTGTLTANSNSQPNITSVGTLANLAVTGNITAGNVYANLGIIGATTLIGTLNSNSNSQPNVTSLGNLTSLNVTGNIRSSAYIGGNVSTTGANAIFVGDGGLLSNLTTTAGSSIVNGNSNIAITANGNITTSVAGIANIFIVSNSGANLSGYLNASGNVTGANANLGNAVTANYFIGNLYGNANVATLANTVTTNAQPNITSVGNLTSLNVIGNITSDNVNATGNMTALNFIGNLVGNISGNIVVPGSNTEVLFNNNGSANASNAFTFNKTSNVMTLNGNIIAGNIFANSGEIRATTFAGTLTTNAQPNITSVGNLTSLNVAGTSNLGLVSNVTITGGSANYVLVTNGSGTLSWSSVAAIPVPGSNTQVIFNDGGNYSANANLTFNKTTGLLTATLLGGTLTTNSQPNITLLGTLSNLNVTGPSILNGNLNTANTNITGILGVTANITTPQFISNVATGTAPFIVTSTTQVANLTVATAGTVTTNAQPNITSTGTLTNVTVSGTSTLGSGATGDIVILGVGGGNLNSSGSDITLYGATGVGLRLGTNGSMTNGIQISTAGLVTVGNLSVTGNLSVGNLVANNANYSNYAGNVTIAAQPNITSTGTLTSVTVSGTSTLGSGATGDVVAFGVGGGNLNSSGSNITLYGATGVGLKLGANGSMTNGIQISTTGVVTTTGNLSVGGTLSGSATGLTSIPGANVTGTVANATYATSAGTATTAGTVTTAAQPNITSVGTLTSLAVTGNISGANLTGTHYGAATGLTSIPGANVTGTVANATYATSAGTATTAGTVTTAAQPNITSTGTLTGVNVSGVAYLGSSITGDIVVLGAGGGNLNSSASNITLYGATGVGLKLGTNGSMTNGIQISTTGVVTTTGNLSVGGTLSGAATGLTSIPGANVTGTVANATYATSAGTATSATTATTAGTVTTAAQPNITSVGTLTSLTLTATTGTLTVPIITTGANSTAGTITGNWSLSAGSQLRATYADLAEYYAGESNIEPGTVVSFGGEQEVQICDSYMSRLVAGIVTTNPAYVMNTDISCEYPIAIALQGRIPAKVIGPIKRGDMMVSANNGYAISCNNPEMGTVLGKALTDFTGESGTIEIMVGRT